MAFDTYKDFVYGWMIFAILLLPVLLTVTAPYGRYATKDWGPSVNNRLAWIIMELPALGVFAYFILSGDRVQQTVIWIFFAFWLVHYVNRVFVYPLRTRTRKKRMPLLIMLFAIFFNTVNGFINGYWFGYLSPSYPLAWLRDPRFILGVVLFIAGAYINHDSDRRLLYLRAGGKTGYYIPYGGFFRYVSCPNFMGEIIEWGGFALMTWCLPALSFFIWTAVNLIHRALDHHRWYRKKFISYPSERKAIIPGIL